MISLTVPGKEASQAAREQINEGKIRRGFVVVDSDGQVTRLERLDCAAIWAQAEQEMAP